MRAGAAIVGSGLTAIALFVACGSDDTAAPAPSETADRAATPTATADGTGTPTASSPIETPTDSGGGADGVDSPDEADALAQSLLITVADIPAGWSEEIAGEDDDEDTFQECDPGGPPGRIGRAATGDFSNGSYEFVHVVAVFESSETAQAALARIEGTMRCIVELINDGGIDTDEFEYSGASLGRGQPPERGDSALNLRLDASVMVRGQTGLGSEADFYIDLVALTNGSIGSSIQTSAVLTPFNSALLADLVTVMADRVEGSTGD